MPTRRPPVDTCAAEKTLEVVSLGAEREKSRWFVWVSDWVASIKDHSENSATPSSTCQYKPLPFSRAFVYNPALHRYSHKISRAFLVNVTLRNGHTLEKIPHVNDHWRNPARPLRNSARQKEKVCETRGKSAVITNSEKTRNTGRSVGTEKLQQLEKRLKMNPPLLK